MTGVTKKSGLSQDAVQLFEGGCQFSGDTPLPVNWQVECEKCFVAEDLLNNRLQTQSFFATEESVTLTEQEKIGAYEQVRVNWKTVAGLHAKLTQQPVRDRQSNRV